mgnify:FL=1
MAIIKINQRCLKYPLHLILSLCDPPPTHLSRFNLHFYNLLWCTVFPKDHSVCRWRFLRDLFSTKIMLNTTFFAVSVVHGLSQREKVIFTFDPEPEGAVVTLRLNFSPRSEFRRWRSYYIGPLVFSRCPSSRVNDLYKFSDHSIWGNNPNLWTETS